MKLLFAGDLSFDWMPKPPLAAMARNLFRSPNVPSASRLHEMHISRLGRARILTQADRLFSGIRQARQTADHFCVNLECALSDRGQSLEKKRYTMRALPHYVLALREMGVTLACLANNHILDFGPDGLTDTTRYLDSAGIQYCGLRRQAIDMPSPAILNTGSERVSVFNVVDPNVIDPDPNHYFSHEPCPFPLDTTSLTDAVAASARTMPVIVVLHWGEEWSYLETGKQRELAHALIDAGASAIIGHHTHLAGIFEEYQGRPIAYSLGNLFLQLPPFSTRRAAPRLMIQLEFAQNAFRRYEIVTIEPDHSGLPSSPASYEAKSLRSDYLPPSIPKTSSILFDSVAELPKAAVTIEQGGRSHQTRWEDQYLCDRSIIEGKLPIGPGWRAEKIGWTGIAKHREFISPEFLSTNLAYLSGEVTLDCRFAFGSAISRLFLIAGIPEGLRNRPGFNCPSLSIQVGEKLLHEFNRERVADGWSVQELPLNKGDVASSDLRVSLHGTKDSLGYLNWRLIGL